METLTWTLYFATPKYLDYMQYYRLLLEQFDYKPVKDPATATKLVEVQLLFAWSRDWTIILSLRKNLFTLHFQFNGLTEKNIIKELGFFIDGSLQGFSFCPPKTFKPNKRTAWNTSHLHGIAWRSGKLEYEKLFAVFYDIKVMNAELFAKGFEKCRLLTRLVVQKVENLDDYGCPKIQDLRRKSEQFMDLL